MMKATVTIIEEYERRVASGAEFLDRHHPGWDRKIDIDRLNMALCGRCVLGQLFGSYLAGLRELIEPTIDVNADIPTKLPSKIQQWAHYHGFFEAGDLWRYDELKTCWVKLIRVRRAVLLVAESSPA